MTQWVIAGGIALLLAFILADYLAGSVEWEECPCYGHTYEAARTYVTSSTDDKGRVHMGTATESEKWRAIVRFNGGTQALSCDPDAWPSAQEGAIVQVRYTLGRFTNCAWAPRIVGIVAHQPAESPR